MSTVVEDYTTEMKRGGQSLEKDGKKKRFKKEKDYIDDGKYKEAITHGAKIMPTNLIKYCGSVYQRPNNKWVASFSGKCKTFTRGAYKTREEAEAYVKEVNIAENLPIKNIIYLYEDEYYCVLTQSQIMKFSIEHLDIVEGYNWFAAYNQAANSFYAHTSSGSGSLIAFHNMLFPDIKEDETVDHKNRITLDNSSSNLRPATKHIQCLNRGIGSLNTSGIKGVYYDPKEEKWHATWAENRKREHRSFSVSKYGAEEAKALAIAIRKEMEETLADYRLAYSK